MRTLPNSLFNAIRSVLTTLSQNPYPQSTRYVDAVRRSRIILRKLDDIEVTQCPLWRARLSMLLAILMNCCKGEKE